MPDNDLRCRRVRRRAQGQEYPRKIAVTGPARPPRQDRAHGVFGTQRFSTAARSRQRVRGG